ncbi:DNA-directed RNA polymerase III subunit RPC3 [Cylas formicarius]|uniref:DNA-directed RNA polymerase III subunit RPC3 n=1 Tax=Cylas formicarius TaxID=197179 RepID=UPI002958346C|nr:DNA-directed RNA polymerase III subunit RPC3 [Cylas formicarius]
MSVIYGRVVSYILSEYFGPVVEKVGTYLFKFKSSPLLYIKRGTDLPLSKIKESLCILIKYGLVTFKPNKNENIANYTLDTEKVLLIIRYPKYLNLAKKQLGDESEMIIEELLQRGYWTASELVLKVFERTSKTEVAVSLSQIKDKVIYLITSKYLTRVPYATDENPVPRLQVKLEELHSLPNIDIKVLVAHQANSTEEFPDKDIYWTVNFDRFHQDMRDQLLVAAVVQKFDAMTGDIFSLFLKQMYIRTEPWADVSNPVPALEIKDILKRQNNQQLLAFFDQYLNIIEQDNSKLIRKAGEASGGSYQIYLKEGVTHLIWELIEQIVTEKFDTKAARIFRLIKSKPYIEPDLIQQQAMIPAKEAKRLSYQLYEENFLRIQEIRKMSSNSGPTKNFTLFYIQLEQVARMVLEMCYKTLFNTFTRRVHEKFVNKRIIDKKQRVDTIAMGMRSQGASQEQLADIEEMITPPEKEILERIEKVVKKLNTVELEIDDTLFLLKTYLMYG